MWPTEARSPSLACSSKAPLIPSTHTAEKEREIEKSRIHWLFNWTKDWEYISNDEIEACGFVPSFEGLRGILIIPPMITHISDSFPSNEAVGSVGVSSFFVLSGFLVTGMLMKGYKTAISPSSHRRMPRIWSLAFGHLARFYTDRVVRLLPPLLFCVITVSIYSFYLGATREYVYSNAFRAILNLQNTHIWEQYQTPFGNSWSLAVEEQFYLTWSLIFPVLYWANLRFRFMILSGCILISLYIRFSSFYYPSSLVIYDWHFSLSANLFKMVIGSSLRLVPIPKALCKSSWGYAGTILLLLTVWSAYSQWYEDVLVWSDTLTAIFTIPTIIGSLHGNYILENSLLRSLGRVSYAWYIWQNPILISMNHYRQGYISFTDTCFALLLAIFSTLYIEEPIRHLYRRHRDGDRKHPSVV